MRTKFTDDEIRKLLIENYPKYPQIEEPVKRTAGYFIKLYLIFGLISLFGLGYVLGYSNNILLMIGCGLPLIAGVIGIVYTTVKLTKEKGRFANEMLCYQNDLKRFEQTRAEYIRLVNEGKYYIQEKIVDKKEDKCDFDAPDKYYINGMKVSQGTYVTTDVGDILRMYGVQGYGMHLIILQKRKDLSKEYEIKTF